MRQKPLTFFKMQAVPVFAGAAFSAWAESDRDREEK